MDDLGHGRPLQIIESLPDRAQSLPLEVAEDDGGEVALPGGQLLPRERGELSEVFRGHALGERDFERGDAPIDMVSLHAVSVAPRCLAARRACCLPRSRRARSSIDITTPRAGLPKRLR